MKLHLINQKEEADNVHTFIFEPEQKMDWQPGQYMHYTFPHANADSRGTERWFTIASAPYENHLQITTRFAGDKSSSFKKALANLKPGDEIEADGPKGKFTLRPGGFRHVLIAGGIGITPYRAMLLQQAHDGKPINADLLYANSGENFEFGEELEQLQAKDPTFRFKKFVGKKITEADLSEYLPGKNTVFYLSGPEAMVQSYEGLLSLLKVDEANIMTDYFPGY